MTDEQRKAVQTVLDWLTFDFVVEGCKGDQPCCASCEAVVTAAMLQKLAAQETSDEA